MLGTEYMARIIVADDEPIHQELVATILKRAGYEVITVENGARCLQLLSNEAIDLVITDIFMPEMDGFQLASDAAMWGFDVPMIAMTGGMRGHFEPFSSIMTRLGAKTVLTKPFTAEQLLSAVRQILD